MNYKKIILASNNKGKINEIKNIFKDYEVISLNDIEQKLNKKIYLKEDYYTHKENAMQKAKELSNIVENDSYIYIADDSGIAIDALDGFPGVKTARWMNADDHTKNIELLKRMENVEEDKRGCKYVNCIALKYRDIEEVFEGVLYGTLTRHCTGKNGFGFDEIFRIDSGLTLAEITMEEKFKISPRKKALDQMKMFLINNYI